MADRLTEIEAFIDGSLVEPGDVRFLLARVRDLEAALRARHGVRIGVPGEPARVYVYDAADIDAALAPTEEQ